MQAQVFYHSFKRLILNIFRCGDNTHWYQLNITQNQVINIGLYSFPVSAAIGEKVENRTAMRVDLGQCGRKFALQLLAVNKLWGMNKFEVTFNSILRYNFPHTTQSLCG